MTNFAFPVQLTPDNDDGGYVVTFRDLPEAITQGDSVSECLTEAVDCLEEAIRLCLPLRDRASHAALRSQLELMII